MEELVKTLLNTADPFARILVGVVVMAWVLREVVPVLRKQPGTLKGDAPKEGVTPDQLRLAILEQCGDCAKIVSLNEKIDQLHAKLDELAEDHEAVKGEVHGLVSGVNSVRRTVERLETRLDQLMPYLARVLNFPMERDAR